MKNKRKKRKAGRIIMCVILSALMCLAIWPVKGFDAFAYNFVKGGAEEAGTVSVAAKAGASQVNGYSTRGGYRVTYTITREDWTGFDDRFGGFFIVGNDMDTRGGCQFAYHTSGGEIWEDGAVTLGYLRDGRQIARCDVASGTVSCSFDVNSLEEIPAYIAYVYEPASSAYLHINSDMGMNAHVWYYKSLQNVPVIGNDSIDTDAPLLTPSVIPTGVTAEIGGKIWSTGARIQVRAEDVKSRPGGIRIYKDGGLVHERENPENGMVLETYYDVNENGSFQAEAYDKLNNTCDKTDIRVFCIDRQAPDIHTLKPASTDYARETKLLSEASDAGCGLHAAAYSWNGGAWSGSKEFLAAANGAYTLKVRDGLGNESSKTVRVSNIDREGPEITHTIKRTGRMATCEGVLWSTSAGLSAQAVDKKSGVSEIRILNAEKEVEAKLENAGDKNKEQLLLEDVEIKNGSYKIWASDVLGNISVTESFEMSHVDKEAPVVKELKTTSLEDGSVLLTVEASDGEEGIGLDDTAYSFDGGKTWQEENSFVFKENGVYEILVRDRLHQEVSREKEITEVFIPEKPDKDKNDSEQGKDETDQEPGDRDKDETGDQEPGDRDKEESGDQEPDILEEPDDKKEEPSLQEEPGDEGNDGENPDPSAGGITPGAGSNPKGAGAPAKDSQGAAGTTRKNGRTGRDAEAFFKEDGGNTVSKNGTGNTVITKKRMIPEKTLRDAEEKVMSQITPQGNQRGNENSLENKQIVGKTILFVLISLFAAGFAGFLLYLLLFYLRYSCVLYGLEENQERHRICRLPVKEKDEEWQVVVPDHKLGLQGTGRYLLLFHPSFVKEEAQSFVIIQIDGKALREKLKEEIRINI